MMDEYFEWLIDRVGYSKKGYNQLLYFLYTVPFRYKLNRDANRVDDAKELFNEYDDNERDFVSVLEVLISLSIRIDDELIGDPSNPNPSMIFWEMCCNLGLDEYDDKHFNIIEVQHILDIWMDRKFNSDGSHSIFPILDPRKDQRKIDIWSQLQEYLSENF